MDDKKRENVTFRFLALWRNNKRYLRRTVFKPYLEMLCLRMIIFYQRYLSIHSCRYKPSCSQYTLECIHNHGVIVGILLGSYRILRCNPWSKGGNDPAPERYFEKRWLL